MYMWIAMLTYECRQIATVIILYNNTLQWQHSIAMMIFHLFFSPSLRSF